MDPFVIACVRAQVRAVLSEISKMEGSEFPYLHAQEALAETKALFEDHRASLDLVSPSSSKDAAKLACNTAFVDLNSSIELLGFLLRSTNIRNAFEAYGSLLRISRQVINQDTKLVVSSEWHFSPFTYVGYSFLTDYVLIGFPAPESSNPLLLPLAGHELGHTAWAHFGLDKDMERKIELAVIDEIKKKWGSIYESFFHGHKVNDVGSDLLARPKWKHAWVWALRQCEEHFCDFFGLRIFGESYLYAFAYLLAPQRSGRRTVHYPTLKERAASLILAASHYGYDAPANYVDLFEELDGPSPEQQRETLLLALAESVKAQFVNILISQANHIVTDSGFSSRDNDMVRKCSKRLSMMIPTENSKGLVNILNAAWSGWLNPNFFIEPEYNKTRLENLKEIVLKSIEVLEIENKLQEVT